MVGHDRAIGTDGLRQQDLRVGILRGLLDDLVECPDEIELPDISDLGERGGDPAPVEEAEQADRGETLRLPVQPPDPRPVLGGAQTVGEVQQTAVEKAPVVNTGPGVRIVHRCGAVDRKDHRARAEHHVPQPVRHPVHRPGAAGDLHMVGADEVALQPLGRGHQVGEVAGGQPVVAVQEGQILPVRRVQAGVPGRGQTAVALVDDHLGAGNVLPGALEDPGRPVGRAVVDEDELEILPGVGPQASEGVGRVCLHVVERHDDGELDHPQHASWRPGTFLVPEKYCG